MDKLSALDDRRDVPDSRMERLFIEPRAVVPLPGGAGSWYFLRHGGKDAWLLLVFFCVFLVVGAAMLTFGAGLAGLFGEAFAREHGLTESGVPRAAGTPLVLMGFGAAFVLFPLALMNVAMTSAGNKLALKHRSIRGS